MNSVLDNEKLVALAREESVRGLIVRQALREAEQADPEQRKVIGQALELLLERFDPCAEVTS